MYEYWFDISTSKPYRHNIKSLDTYISCIEQRRYLSSCSIQLFFLSIKQWRVNDWPFCTYTRLEIHSAKDVYIRPYVVVFVLTLLFSSLLFISLHINIVHCNRESWCACIVAIASRLCYLSKRTSEISKKVLDDDDDEEKTFSVLLIVNIENRIDFSCLVGRSIVWKVMMMELIHRIQSNNRINLTQYHQPSSKPIQVNLSSSKFE